MSTWPLLCLRPVNPSLARPSSPPAVVSSFSPFDLAFPYRPSPSSSASLAIPPPARTLAEETCGSFGPVGRRFFWRPFFQHSLYTAGRCFLSRAKASPLLPLLALFLDFCRESFPTLPGTRFFTGTNQSLVGFLFFRFFLVCFLAHCGSYLPAAVLFTRSVWRLDAVPSPVLVFLPCFSP